jgi:hypothetical protein
VRILCRWPGRERLGATIRYTRRQGTNEAHLDAIVEANRVSIQNGGNGSHGPGLQRAG